MRAIKRSCLPLTAKKKVALQALCQAYSKEKRYWLDYLKAWDNQQRLGKPRSIRDDKVKEKYHSKSGLQARHWKLALTDAVETWDKYWQALFTSIRLKIFHSKELCEKEKHDAHFLLKDYSQFAQAMKGEKPSPPFEIEDASIVRVVGYLRKWVKKKRGKNPSVKKARSVRFDADCYEAFDHKGRQYLKLMSLERGQTDCHSIKREDKNFWHPDSCFRQRAAQHSCLTRIKKTPLPQRK